MHRKILFISVVIFASAAAVFSGAEEQAVPCPARSAQEWITHVAEGKYEAAAALVGNWSRTPGCSCASSESACLEIILPDGSKETVSPGKLDQYASEAVAWEIAGRKKCDPLSGSDELGIIARRTCLERHAESMDGIKEETAKKLLRDALKSVADRLAAGVTAEEAPTKEGTPRWVPGEKTTLQERSEQRAMKIAGEICSLKKGLREVEERLANMDREKKFIPTEYYQRLQRQQKLRDDIQKEIERGSVTFKQLMGREFDPLKDCFNTEPSKP